MSDDPGRASVDEALAAHPPDVRAALERLRRLIRDAAPEAVETIAYGVPAFRYLGRPFVSYGAAKAHCSFYVQSPDVMQDFASELADYRTTKGSVHFTPERPLPPDLVERLVRARMAELEARAPR